MKNILKITPINSLNNSTYNITIFHKKYFLKVTKRNNTKLIKLLEDKDITPKGIFTSKRILFTKYISNANLDEKLQNTEVFLKAISSELKKLHSLSNNNYNNPFDKIKDNLSSLEEIDFPLPPYTKAIIHKFKLLEEELSKDINLGLCHNDLNPSNILYKNNKVYLVDFDFIGMNDIYYDLATLSWFLSKDMRKKLLFFYFGDCTSYHVDKLDKYIFIAKLWNATWSYNKSLVSNSDYNYKLGGDLIMEDLYNYISKNTH